MTPKRVTIVRDADGDRTAFVRTLVGANEVYVTDPDPRPVTAVVLGSVNVAGRVLASYEVDERVVWDEPIDGDVYSMFAFFRPPAGADDWIERYREHAAVARVHHPGIRRYVQNVVTAQSSEGRWTMSGISELHFAGRDSYGEQFWLSDESRMVVQRDFERFSDPSTAKTIVAARLTSVL